MVVTMILGNFKTTSGFTFRDKQTFGDTINRYYINVL